MSKSLGNFVTIRDFLEKYPAEVFRMMVAAHHYRSPMDYSEELVSQTQNSLLNLKQFIGKLRLAKAKTGGQSVVDESIKKATAAFHEAMADDFNTPGALAAVFALINDLNPGIWNLRRAEAKTIENWIMGALKTIGIEIKLAHIPLKIRSLAKKRELCRSNKQFVQADALRKEVEALGYLVDDTPAGPLLLKKDR